MVKIDEDLFSKSLALNPIFRLVPLKFPFILRFSIALLLSTLLLTSLLYLSCFCTIAV